MGIWLVKMLKIVGFCEEEDGVGGCSYRRECMFELSSCRCCYLAGGGGAAPEFFQKLVVAMVDKYMFSYLVD